jgi:hypothetical protein
MKSEYISWLSALALFVLCFNMPKPYCYGPIAKTESTPQAWSFSVLWFVAFGCLTMLLFRGAHYPGVKEFLNSALVDYQLPNWQGGKIREFAQGATVMFLLLWTFPGMVCTIAAKRLYVAIPVWLIGIFILNAILISFIE